MSLLDLTLEEKIKLLVGSSDGDYMYSEGLNGKVHRIYMNDGPIGPHQAKPLLWLPSITSLASTWNKEIVIKYVDALADICITNDVEMLLGPAINIKRLATCGRNFEYFSEDPYLTGELAKTYVTTLQDRGVGATVKHFCCNNREDYRLYCSSNVSLRALREIYTKAFEKVCEVKPWAIMCSYNGVNGTSVAENKYILKDLLRDQIHHQNLIVSDWGAVRNRALALKATLDLQMPYQNDEPYESLRKGLKDGIITEDDINASIKRLEELLNKIEKSKSIRAVKYSDEQRHKIAVETCEEGIVLLKNHDNILPLGKNQNILVVGEHAEDPELGGGGSCNLGDDPALPFDERFAVKQESLVKLLKEHFGDSNVDYVCGYHCYKGFGNQYGHLHGPSYLRKAKDADVIVMVVGTNRTIECEGFDRENLDLPKVQEEVLERIIKLNKNIVVVVEAGGVINTSKFRNKVNGIIYSGFGGEAMNEALFNVLVGKTNPSGKLAETFIDSLDVNPYVQVRGDIENEDYNDDIFVGYRLYDTRNIPVAYSFGYGLSYTNFEYKNLKIEDKGNFNYLISFDITNTGNMDGKEISQLYVSAVDGKIDRPKKELKGFSKVFLKVGETKNIQIEINHDAFTYFDELANDWKIPSGTYKIQIGKSCADIILGGYIKIN